MDSVQQDMLLSRKRLLDCEDDGNEEPLALPRSSTEHNTTPLRKTIVFRSIVWEHIWSAAGRERHVARPPASIDSSQHFESGTLCHPSSYQQIGLKRVTRYLHQHNVIYSYCNIQSYPFRHLEGPLRYPS